MSKYIEKVENSWFLRFFRSKTLKKWKIIYAIDPKKCFKIEKSKIGFFSPRAALRPAIFCSKIMFSLYNDTQPAQFHGNHEKLEISTKLRPTQKNFPGAWKSPENPGSACGTRKVARIEPERGARTRCRPIFSRCRRRAALWWLILCLIMSLIKDVNAE